MQRSAHRTAISSLPPARMKLLLWEPYTGRLCPAIQQSQQEVLRLAFTPQGDQLLGVERSKSHVPLGG